MTATFARMRATPSCRAGAAAQRAQIIAARATGQSRQKSLPPPRTGIQDRALVPSPEERGLWSRGEMAWEFRTFVQLVAIGLQARIPMHMTGFPGVGKTEFTKSLEAGFDRVGIKCKVVVLVGSIREPQDFGGFPVSTPDGVRLLPMAWARDAEGRAEDGYLGVGAPGARVGRRV